MKKYIHAAALLLLFLAIPVEGINAETTNEPAGTQENALVGKEALHKLGFYHGNIDDASGGELQSAIKEFQLYHGLSNFGMVDEETEKKIESELQESYFFGDSDPEILELQQTLIMLGYGKWEPSTEFELSTEGAVLAFQEDHTDLIMTGVLDTKTQLKIKLEIEKLKEAAAPSEPEVEGEPAADSVESAEETAVVEDAAEQVEPELALFTDVPEDTPLQKGVRSDAVKELQENLIRLGFGSWDPTTYFGSTTEDALMDFQEYHGLPVTGMVDETTENKIDSELQNTFFYGDRDAEILDLQNRLIMLGYGNWNPTVRFGPTTENAVLAFQESYSDLKVTGVLDTKTQAKLKQETEVLKKGLRSDEVKELQEKLIRLGFGNWNPTTYFGSTTEGALKEFQEYHGVSVTGTFDEATENKLESELQDSYFFDDRDNEIIEIQNRLIMLGFGNWNPTVRFGPTTERAILAFQEYYADLKVTGVIDTKTQAKLKQETEDLLHKGVRSDAVKELQQELIRLGFGNWNPTTYFGSTTEKAVKAFQKYYGLNANGIFNRITQDRLEEIGSLPLGPGLKRPDVKGYQETLMQLGFATWTNSTECFCAKTEKATKEFQKYHGLPVTGIVNENTEKKLESELRDSYFYDDRDAEIVELQNRLIALGYGNWNPTVRFGPTTERAVIAFQKYYSGLKVTGVLDTKTQERLKFETENVLHKGIRSNAVKELQENLIRLGFGSWNPTTYYGSTTEGAVERFQKHYSIIVNGIYDTRTEEKLEEVLNSPYQYGKTSSNIRVLQEQLINLGFGDWNPTKFFGSITEGAVKSFQKQQGLPVSGIADEITLREIEKAVKNKVVKIFLDPGHGGSDPGGSGYGLQEKTVVLDIALKTRAILTNNYRGIEVKLSRTNDRFIPLNERTDMANEWGADYFVSFHTNAFNGSARGFETFIYNGSVSNETKQRQRDIHNYLINRINVSDRGIQRANFHVLRETNMPSILLEYMFIDNIAENHLLKSASYRTSLAQYTADAIARSYGLKRK